MMIVALIVIVSLTSGADAVTCYKCSNSPTNVTCNESNTCEGNSCFIAVLNTTLFHTGCADDEAPIASCFTQGQRRICTCASNFCNYGKAMPSFRTAFMPPMMGVDLNTFFESLTAIVSAAPPAAAQSTATAEPAKELTSAAPAEVVASSTQAEKDDSSEESSASPAVDASSTATTPKPNGGTAAPFLIAAALFGAAALLF